MLSRITKLALSLGLTMSMGLAFGPLGCGTSEEAVFTPVHPPGHSTSRSPEVPERVEKQLTACLQHSSAPLPPAEGNTYAVMFNVRASRSGRVHAVEIKDSTLGGHEVEACFAGVLQGMTLPMQDLAMRLADRAPLRPPAPPARALVANPAAPALGLAPVALTPVVLTVFGFIIVVAILVYVVSEASDITLDPPLAATAMPTATAVPTATAIPVTRRYPNQTCDDEVLDRLQEEKKRLCNAGYAADCSGNLEKNKRLKSTPCSAIRLSLEQRYICLKQRNLIQEKCFGGIPDAAHRGAIEQVQNGVNRCETLKLINCAKGHPMAGL